MGLFSTNGAQGASTVGAGKSGATSRSQFGPDSPLFWLGLAGVGFVINPLAMVVFGIAAAISQQRRVRASRMWAAFGISAAVSTLFSLVAGAGIAGAIVWQVQAFAQKVTSIGSAWDAATGTAGSIIAALVTALFTAAWAMLAFGIPVGLGMAAAYSSWMTVRRAPILDVEGFDWHRPVGWMDRRKGRQNKEAIQRGDFTMAATTTRKGKVKVEGQVALGLGEYGVPVVIPVDGRLRPTLVLGGPGTGKTAGGMSLLFQDVALGSGACVIDFKGDEYLPAQMAESAASHGRRFHHFILAAKDGSPYVRPHPEAFATPAFYDPLVRGNATSKTDMLVNSVGREGDAAAYFRAAYDLVQVIYEVAGRSGYDKGKGGFEVVGDLLDLDKLQTVADTAGPDGRGVLADVPELAKRVGDLVNKVKSDSVLKGAIGDTQRLISTYLLGPAAGPFLRPGLAEHTINLARAAREGDLVLFSLSVQDYGSLAADIGTLVLLDLQNTVSELRTEQTATGKGLDHPFYVQIEEFGSAGPEAVLGVLNKSRDVNVRPTLSTQSWNDVVAVDGTGTFARQVLDQCGNFFLYGINDPDAAELMAGVSGKVTKKRPRESKQFSAGFFGTNLKAANMGKLDTTAEEEPQVPAKALQSMPLYHCAWITKVPTLRSTHTFEPGPNHWWEQVSVVLVPPGVLPTVEVASSARSREVVVAPRRRWVPTVNIGDLITKRRSAGGADSADRLALTAAPETAEVAVEEADPWADIDSATDVVRTATPESMAAIAMDAPDEDENGGDLVPRANPRPRAPAPRRRGPTP